MLQEHVLDLASGGGRAGHAGGRPEPDRQKAEAPRVHEPEGTQGRREHHLGEREEEAGGLT